MFPSKAVWEVVSQPFKRSQLGLFQGKTKQYGNNVPFSKHKTRRSWLPNVQQKRLPSKILGENLTLKLTTRALKTIKKKGGLDNYLKTTSGELLGHKGMELRMRLRAKEAERRNAKGAPNVALMPTLAAARSARQVAAWALGVQGIASSQETISYLQSLKTKKSKSQRPRSAGLTPRRRAIPAPETATSKALTPLM